jgi:hypothetical protein
MTETTFVAIIAFIGFVFAGVVYLAKSQGKLLADALPPWALPIIIEGLKAAKEAALQTPTTADDDLIQLMINELEKRGLVVVQNAPDEPVLKVELVEGAQG